MMKTKLFLVILLFTGLTGFRYYPLDYRLFFRLAEKMPEKTLTVVLRPDSKEDDQLREIVKKRWTISPFEFVTPEEADKLATDTGRVFLFKAWLSAAGTPSDYKLYLSTGIRNVKKLAHTRLLDEYDFFSAPPGEDLKMEAEFIKNPCLQIVALNRIHLDLIAGVKSNRNRSTFSDLVADPLRNGKKIPAELQANKKVYYDNVLIPEAEIDWFSGWSKIERNLFLGVDSKKLSEIMLKNEKDVLLLTVEGIAGSGATYSMFNQEGKNFYSNAITHY